MDQTLTQGVHDYFGKMWRLRYFLLSQVKLDLRTRYRGSFLGIFWSLVKPVAMTGILCLVFWKVFNCSLTDYAPFLFTGLTIWQFIVETTTQGCGAFVQGGRFIRQQPLPLAIFPLRTVLGSSIHSAIALGLAILVTWYFKGFANLSALWILPFMLLMLLVFCWSTATIMGLVNAHFPDTQHMLDIFFQLLFYLTPVMYPPGAIRSRERLAWIIDLNPLTHILEAIRLPILEGRLPPANSLLIVGGLVAGTFVLALLVLKRLQRSLVFWL